MQRNEGTADRAMRMGGGLLLIGLAIAGVIGPGGYAGVVLLLTGAVGICPLYAMLGIDTCAAGRR